MDPFAALFAHTTPRARTFFTGTLCKTVQYPDVGHLHFLKDGKLTLVQSGQSDLRVDEPTLLFFPRGRAHSFVVNPERGADLVCATVELGGAEGNPIGQGLPELVVLPLVSHPALAPICDLLLGEAFSERGGRQEALDRLFDYLLILIVRHVVESGRVPNRRACRSRRSTPCQGADRNSRGAEEVMDPGRSRRHRRHVTHTVR